MRQKPKKLNKGIMELLFVQIGYFLGPAGSGKSHMTNALYNWMNQLGLDVITLNLDPAVLRLPYAPSIDVRNYIFYDEIVDKYELGPNGAIIASIDQIALEFDEILNELADFGADYVLLDLPGQLEAFAYRSSGPLILQELKKDNLVGGLFLIDPILCTNASNFISILLLGYSIKYRLNTALNFAFSKGDLILSEKLDQIEEWCENPDFLLESIRNESTIVSAGISTQLFEIIISEGSFEKFPAISSQTNENIDLAFANFQRIWNSEDIFS